jgi:hypothetical protein
MGNNQHNKTPADKLVVQHVVEASFCPVVVVVVSHELSSFHGAHKKVLPAERAVRGDLLRVCRQALAVLEPLARRVAVARVIAVIALLW